MKDRFVLKRFVNVMMFLFVTVLYTVLLGVKEAILLDRWLCLVILDVIFFVLLVVLLEHNRQKKQIAQNTETDYRKMLVGFAFSSGIAFLCSFFPEFGKPVILISILMMALGTQEIAVVTGFYLCFLLAIAMDMSSMELICCLCMLMFGCVISKAMEMKHLMIWNELSILSLSTLLPVLFSYLYHQEFSYRIILWGVCEGLAVVLFLALFYEKLTVVRNTEIDTMLIDIQDTDYSLARELKSFSRKDFAHAKRVSQIAGKCAQLVNADEQVCRAAAFYYRIGILEGDQIASNGVNIAIDHCFPERVTTIISEYHGLLQKPSTIESAIVQIVDGLIKKLEVLDQTTMSSTWNQDMVIYQTLNEFSAEGMYDQSGLSMNMFLKIREYLVKEENLLN